jgi:hypothetical protein
MKSIVKILLGSLVFWLVPFSIIAGQQKSNEQKIKIVVDDGSGTRVVIDTIFKNGNTNDSIKLKNGKVIYLSHSGDEMNFNTHEGMGSVFVAVSSADKETGNYRVITRSSDGEDLKNGSVYINSGDGDTDMDRAFDVFVDKGSKTSDEEKTKYVIKRDGMVISIEGGDYAKVRELVREIESSLDKKHDGEAKADAVKEDSKTTGKKK